MSAVPALLGAFLALSGKVFPNDKNLSFLPILVGLGLTAGLAWLVVGYFMATPSDQRPDCSDCYVYLGRWWEPGFAVFIIGLTFVAWMFGVLVGSAARAIKLRRVGPGT